ncbi:MAG TPA: RsmE family RNA methyltransferase [Cyclobacteriaceae bacterium]|nr:RsmE family RNA methyltransferase [Cyclobacteriaceae bacterium]
MHLFYQPDISTGILPPEESHHAVKVLRLGPGSIITLTDGAGYHHQAVLTDVTATRAAFQITNTTHTPKRNFSIHLAIAPTKNIERIEWLLEKGTEIGLESITPVLCKTSERKVVNHDRLEKVIVSALKQSMQAYKPVLHPLTDFGAFVKQHSLPSQRFIAHMEATARPLARAAVPRKDYVILIGPEGDFTPAEVNLAQENKFVSVGLGPSRLRTETAGLMAVAVLNLLQEQA